MSAARPTVPRWPGDRPSDSSLGERAVLIALGAVVIVVVLAWLAGGLAGMLFGAGWPHLAPGDLAGVLVRLPGHLGDPAQAWPPGVRGKLPGPVGFYAAAALLVFVVGVVACGVARTLARWRSPLGARAAESRGASWARRRELRDLRVTRSQPGRLTLGRVGGSLVAGEPRQSAIVIAPTQSLKTTGLAVPAILEWDGPVLATSVKTDLLRHTLARRRALGDVFVYDPTGTTGARRAGWTPLAACRGWQGAQRTAASLSAAAQPGHSALSDADFWYAAAAKLLAPVLFAAAASERSMADVVRWVDTQERDQVQEALLAAGVEEALIAAEATWQRDDRQRSSIYTTAETVLAAYADPDVVASAERSELTPARLLDGGAHTAFVCAPTHEQQRLRPLFATLIEQILAGVYERAGQTGAPLDPPLLVVLDEAANIAPLPDLDALASTAAGQGIQLVCVFQDLAQLKERWGARAQTIVNNHRAKIIGAGSSDPDTLEYAARVLGDQEIRQVSATAGDEGRGSQTESTTWRALAPPHAVRQARPGTGVLIYGHLPPARLELRPWFADRHLRQLATAADPVRLGRA